jgi:hypothetical protein
MWARVKAGTDHESPRVLGIRRGEVGDLLLHPPSEHRVAGEGEWTSRSGRAEVNASQRVVLDNRLPARYGKDDDRTVDRNFLVAPSPSWASGAAMDGDEIVAVACRALEVGHRLVDVHGRSD